MGVLWMKDEERKTHREVKSREARPRQASADKGLACAWRAGRGRIHCSILYIATPCACFDETLYELKRSAITSRPSRSYAIDARRSFRDMKSLASPTGN